MKMDDHVFPATLANNKVIQGKLSLLSTFFCFENVNNQQKRKRKNQFLYIHSSKFQKKVFRCYFVFWNVFCSRIMILLIVKMRNYYYLTRNSCRFFSYFWVNDLVTWLPSLNIFIKFLVFFFDFDFDDDDDL